MDREDNLTDRPRTSDPDLDDDDRAGAQPSEKDSGVSIDPPDAGEPYTDP
jgi:hypothetical protein